MKWENVYIFISSTFNDMHAERDYLIKRVFPKLKLWCNDRKLKLIDVDLRWGVSEADATENKRVVDVCLKNLDKCRPFFIGLLGQRRGWVPGLSDINRQTIEQFPGLSAYLGKYSITELEIIHGLIQPLDGTQNCMRHAFFFYRRPGYLAQIDSEEVKQIYQGENGSNQESSEEVTKFRESLKQKYEIIEYDADWNQGKASPELRNVRGKDLSAGRLDHFRIGDFTLADYVTDRLKKAIEEEFPEHFSVTPPTDALERELVHQDTFLFNACDSYIPRPKAEEAVLDYFQGDSARPYVLKANAGCGKTSMLAHLIRHEKIPGNVFYRFIGTSAGSFDMSSTIYLLMEEMSRQGLLPAEEVQKEKEDILLAFSTLLGKVKKESCCIILDGVDQWDEDWASSLNWIPERLPEHIKLLVSVKTNGNEQLLNKLESKGFQIHSLDPMSGREDKKLLIQGFLSQFLKDIDHRQIEQILLLEGSSNPLYLKIILNELRIHGSFDTLMEQFDRNYGKTPKEAFRTVLERLERETFSDIIEAPLLTKYFLGIMANSTESVRFEDYVTIFKVHVFGKHGLPGNGMLRPEDVMDAVYGLARHLSPYLVIDGNRVNFLYDSFRQAVRERYEDSYTEMQGILATIYLEYCNPDKVMHYQTPIASHLTALIYHGMEFSRSFTEELLINPWYLYRLLSMTSARKTATYYMQAYEKGYRSYDFKTVSEVLASISARLDIGPNIPFYELKSRAAHECDAIRILCETAEKEMELPYYYPVSARSESGTLSCAEIALLKEDNLSSAEPYIQDDMIIYTSEGSAMVVVQSLLTGEIMKKMKLRKSVWRSYVADNYLYVWYYTEDMDHNGPIETLRLPSFESVFYKEERPALPEGFAWQWIPFGVNGQHYQYAVKNHEAPECLLYNLSTGARRIHSTYSGYERRSTSSSFQICFCGEYLGEFSYAYETSRIWHIPSGMLVYEEQGQFFLKLAYEAGKLWCLARKENQTFLCSVFEKNGQEIKMIEQKGLHHQRIYQVKRIGVWDGQLFLFFPSGIVWVYDRNLQFVGSKKLDYQVSNYEAQMVVRYYHRFLYSFGEYLALFHRSRLLFFSKEELMGSLQRDYLFETNGGSAQIMAYDKNIAFLSEECRRWNLRNLRITHIEETPLFTYDTDNVYCLMGNRYVLGCTGDYEQFYIQMLSLEDMKVGFRSGKPYPKGFARNVTAEFYYNGKLGVIFEKKGTSVDPDYSSAAETEGTKYAVFYYDIFQQMELVDYWEIDAYGKRSKPTVYLAYKKPYIVFLDTSIDKTHTAIQVYDGDRKELALSYVCDLKKYSVKLSQGVLCQEGKLYVPVRIKDEFRQLLIEFDAGSNIVKEHFLEFGDIKGFNGKELFSYQDLFHRIHVYSLEAETLVGTITTSTAGFCYKIMRKGEDILAFYNTDIMEVYDGKSYEYKYRQTYPSVDNVIIMDCPGTDYIYIGNDKNEYYLYALR